MLNNSYNVVDVKKNLILAIYVKSRELEKFYADVPLNGTQVANNHFFIRIAFESVLQGKWDTSFEECTFTFLGKEKTMLVDFKILHKVFNRLLTFSESSEELYWSIIYSLSLRRKKIETDITQSKNSINLFMNEKKKYKNYKDQNKIETKHSGVAYFASKVNNYNYGRINKSSEVNTNDY